MTDTQPGADKARELLADEEEAEGFTEYAAWLRAGCPDGPRREGNPNDYDPPLVALRAIEKALASPHVDGQAVREAALEHEVREAAERLSVEGQLIARTDSEASLRAKMDSIARDLFAALKSTQGRTDGP